MSKLCVLQIDLPILAKIFLNRMKCHLWKDNEREIQDKTEKVDKCAVTWHLDSIHHHIFHVQQTAQSSLHLGGGHVLSFPAVRVSCAVFEIHVAIVVHLQHVP